MNKLVSQGVSFVLEKSGQALMREGLKKLPDDTQTELGLKSQDETLHAKLDRISNDIHEVQTAIKDLESKLTSQLQQLRTDRLQSFMNPIDTTYLEVVNTLKYCVAKRAQLPHDGDMSRLHDPEKLSA